MAAEADLAVEELYEIVSLLVSDCTGKASQVGLDASCSLQTPHHSPYLRPNLALNCLHFSPPLLDLPLVALVGVLEGNGLLLLAEIYDLLLKELNLALLFQLLSLQFFEGLLLEPSLATLLKHQDVLQLASQPSLPYYPLADLEVRPGILRVGPHLARHKLVEGFDAFNFVLSPAQFDCSVGELVGMSEVGGEGMVVGEVGGGELEAVGGVVGGSFVLSQPIIGLSQEVGGHCEVGGSLHTHLPTSLLLAVDALRQLVDHLAENELPACVIFPPQAGHPLQKLSHYSRLP